MSERDNWQKIFDHAREAIDSGSKTVMLRLLLRILLAAEAKVRTLGATPEQAPTGEDARGVLPTVRVVRHKKRGTSYTVLGEGELQASAGSDFHHAEGAVLVVYKDRVGDRLWIREKSEFEDGRFEEL